jgi:hypothetical protein
LADGQSGGQMRHSQTTRSTTAEEPIAEIAYEFGLPDR